MNEYHSELLSELLKIKKEHQKILLESNMNLISEICKGEGLDEIEIREKYLNSSKKETVIEIQETNSEETEQLLSHMKFEGADYFYEDKMNGSVYDSKNKKVGTYSCGSIVFA